MARPSPEAVKNMLHEACRQALAREDCFAVFDIMQTGIIIADSLLDSETEEDVEATPDFLEGMYQLATGDRDGEV